MAESNHPAYLFPSLSETAQSLPLFASHTAHSDKRALPPRPKSPPSKRPRCKTIASERSVFPLDKLPREVITVVLEHVAGVSFQRCCFSDSADIKSMRLALRRLLPVAAASHALCDIVMHFFKTFIPFEHMYRILPSVYDHDHDITNSNLFAAARNAAHLISQHTHPPDYTPRSHRKNLYNSLSVFSKKHTWSCRVATSCALLLRPSEVLDTHFLINDYSPKSIRCILNALMFMNIRFKKLVIPSLRQLPFVTSEHLCFKSFLRSVGSSLTHLEMPISVEHQRANFSRHVFPAMPQLQYIHFKVQHMDECDTANGPCFQLLPNQLLRGIGNALPGLRVVTVENMYRTQSESYEIVQLPSSVSQLRIVRDESIINAFRNSNQLRVIIFHRTQIDLQKLAKLMPRKAFPNLNRIALVACDLVLKGSGHSNVRCLSKKIQTLMHDNACRCTPLKSTDLKFLQDHCPNLSVLDLWLAAPSDRLSWLTLGRLVEKLTQLRVLIVDAGPDPEDLEDQFVDSYAQFYKCLTRNSSAIEHLALIGSCLNMETFKELIRVKGADLRSLKVKLFSEDELRNAYGVLNTFDAIQALCAIRKYCPKLESLCLNSQEEIIHHMSQTTSLSSSDRACLDVNAAEEVWEQTAKDFCCVKFRQRLTKGYGGIDAEV